MNIVEKSKEFQGLGGVNQKIYMQELKAKYSEDLNMAGVKSQVKVIVVFRLFKLFAGYFWITVLNWEFFQLLTIPKKWYFLIICPETASLSHI